MTAIETISGIAAILMLCGGYFLARIQSDSNVLKIWRGIWNFYIKACAAMFRLLGLIPGMGILFLWAGNFMDNHLVVRIDESDEERRIRKRQNREVTNEILQASEEMLNASIEKDKRRKEQEAEYEAQRQKDYQDNLRRNVANATGDGNLQFNSDGSYVRRPGGSWEKTSDVENSFK